MDLNTLTKTEKKATIEKPERWYLGDGVSKIAENGNSFLQITVGDFPESKWEEWNKDCKENFSNCRWAKMSQDHIKAKMFDLLVENKFSIKQDEKKEKPSEEILIGGETIER